MMTKLDLTQNIGSHLRDIERRVQHLQSSPLEDPEACEAALEEITHLYGAVALCRSLLKQIQSQQKPAAILEFHPSSKAADRRSVPVRKTPFDGPMAS